MSKELDIAAAPMDAAKAVAETPSQAAIESLASRVAEVVASKSLSRAEVKEMFEEYVAQRTENAKKAVEGRPEEASVPDAANLYQAKSAFEWLKGAGLAAEPKTDREELDALKAVSTGMAYILIKGNDKFRGFDAAIKDKALGQYEGYVAKALGVDDFTAGGALSPTQMATEVTTALLSESAVFGDPAIQVVPVNGQMEFPYEATAPTEAWSAENGAANATEPAYDQVTLRPERVDIIVPVSNKMLRSVPMAAAAVEQSIRMRFGERIDNKLLRSVGAANTPIGLRYLAASANILNVKATVSAANTETDLLRLFQVIQAANVPMRELRFAFSPRTWRYLFGLRGTDVHLFKQDMLSGRLLGVKIAGQSGRGISNIPENLAVTDTSETEIYLYETSGLRLGIGDEMTMKSSDVAAYNDSSGTVQAALSRNQMVFAMHAEVGLVDVYRGLGISVLSDVDWGV